MMFIRCDKSRNATRACLAWVTIPLLVASLALAESHTGLSPSKDGSLVAYQQGAILLKKGKSTEAIEYFKTALRLNPRLAEARNGLGNALVQQGKLIDAVQEFRKAIQLKLNYADAHFNLAVTLSQLGADDAAIAEYKAAIGTGHADAQVYNNLALLVWKNNDLNGALAYLRSASDLDPRSISIRVNLGLLLEELKDFLGASAEFQSAMRVNPRSTKPAIELAILERRRGNIETAEMLLRKAIRLGPKSPEAHYELGLLLQSKGLPRAAAKEFRTTLLLEPNDSAAQYNLDLALSRIRQSKGSAVALGQLRARDDTDQQKDRARTLDARGVELAKQGEFNDARGAFLEAQRLAPTTAEYFYNLGVLELSRNDLQAAESQFRRALKLKPFYPDAHNDLGVTLWHLGDNDAAVSEFREAIKQMPTPEEYRNIGLLLREMGDESASSFLIKAESMQKADLTNDQGDDACRSCHSDKVNSFHQTAHYLTSQVPDEKSILGSFAPANNLLKTANPNLFFRMVERHVDGKDEFLETAVTGTPPHTDERSEQFDIVVGAGHGQTYLYWNDDLLFQLPVSYWKGLGWVNSPGYRDGSAIFDRPITPRCLECHATYIETRPPPSNRYTRESFVPGIQCEKCHGPGGEHVQRETTKSAASSGSAILNPARFPREQQMDLCAWCHSGQGDVLLPSFSYKPGEPLARYIRQPQPDPDAPLDVHGNQVGMLRVSRCFQDSQMTCLTCHDSHAPQHDLARFSQRCMSCHKPDSATFLKAGHPVTNNCIDCHMPRLETNLIVFDWQGKSVTPEIRSHWIKVYAPAAYR